MDFIDIISVLSFYIAIQNLQENEEQTEALKNHLKEQDGVLEEQTNIYLKKLIKQNEEIIRLLKGG